MDAGAAGRRSNHASPVRNRVHQILDAAVQRRPSAAAVRDSQGSWTYEQLAHHSFTYVTWLRDRGVSPGDRLLVCTRPDRRVAALLYACSRIGSTFVPVATGTRGMQWDSIVRDSAPALILADEESFPPLQDVASPVLASDVAPSAVAEAPSGAKESRGLVAPAFLIYTSGSTSAPKGVICPHPQVLFVTRAIADVLRYRTSDIVYSCLPLSFDYGLYQLLLAALATAEVVLAGGTTYATLLADIRRSGATVVPIVPSLGTMLIQLAMRDRTPTQLRLFTNTGEALPVAVIEALRAQFPGAGVQLMFGITECKRVSILDVDGDRRHPGSVGLPLRGTRVRVIGPCGDSAPVGSIGEIVVSGPHVMAGYWRSPDLTALRFGRDPDTGQPSLRTGDYGSLDQDGHLHFHGRGDLTYKHHGVRTSTMEIEAAAREIPGVVDVAVVPPDGRRGPVLCVVSPSSPGEILRLLRERLDPIKVPSICRVFSNIPQNANGKVDRAGLLALLGDIRG